MGDLSKDREAVREAGRLAVYSAGLDGGRSLTETRNVARARVAKCLSSADGCGASTGAPAAGWMVSIHNPSDG